MNNTTPTKNDVFKLVQNFLRIPPVIIWGSGATIPYGLPGMKDFRKSLQSELQDIDSSANLESVLAKIEDEESVDKIRKIIKAKVLKSDITCLKKFIQNENHLEPVTKMIEKFYNAHPQKIDIVTTNYDRVLEYAISRAGYNYTDGFTGQPLSKFSKSSFREEKIINLIKVHGSLNWIIHKDNLFFLPYEPKINGLRPVMILPSKRKFQDAYKEPYRTLIARSDESIEKADSFLVVGFGFNDEHLTPKIEGRIKQGIPIVIVTKEATDSCKNKISSSSQYCLFEESGNQTKVTFREKSEKLERYIYIDDDYWSLNKFMEVL